MLEGSFATLAETALGDILIPVPNAESAEPNHSTAASGRDSTAPESSHVSPTPPDSAGFRVVTVSCAGTNISPVRSDALPQPTPETAISADAVFQLPGVTD
ncbi:hypothetical protein N657DRAFT_649305 [Parathielavia appendiculata]|uniref:Uncharacterized protein n=1 Tax=Parathielavia appendiculata TaxID=2587402 RepID=A0AAN6TTN2_9PEZI|nr:hypothetical protein N657DRAFT_649305 [Parathielavia appendiculata]